MKQAGSICIVLICIFVLAVQETNAARGCNAYGHACYGGHGKRSLRTQDEVRADAMMQINPNEDREYYVDPRYRAMKVYKQLFNPISRQTAERINDLEYAISNEMFKENN